MIILISNSLLNVTEYEDIIKLQVDLYISIGFYQLGRSFIGEVYSSKPVKILFECLRFLPPLESINLSISFMLIPFYSL